jgi:methyl-accepting chemotaxis protein
MSLKFKLYGGFGVLVILVVGLVLYAMQVFGDIGSSVTRMNLISENSTRTLEIEELLGKLRESALRYSYNRDEPSQKENGETAALVLSALQAAEKATPTEERKKIYRDVQAQLASTQQTTQSLFDLGKQMAQEKGQLTKFGNGLTEATQALVDKAEASSNQSVALLAAKLKSQMLLLRISSFRAQASLDAAGIATLKDAAAKSLAALAALEHTDSEEIHGQIEPIRKALTDFPATTEIYVKQLQQASDLYANKIGPQISQMQATIAALRGLLQQSFSGVRSSVEGSITSTLFNQKVVGVIAFLFGGLIAFLIGRSISNPIAALTKGMRELADGNFGVVLPGLKRKDEIGNIAKAVEAFKVKAAEKAEAEAQAKAEQDRQAEAERQAAMEKMSNEFEDAVGGIVQSAVAGDFSKRVELKGKTGLVLNIGTAINSLCDNVAKALGDLIEMLSALAEGNLSQRITTQYQGDFAELKNNANTAAERIGQIVTQIKEAAQEVSSASAEISSSTTDLSQRTEEQAASLEETSASMEEIAATVKKNAENAQAANQSTAKARQVANHGGDVVAKAVAAMAQISTSSGKISDIIGVIDEIARQTNLLALNAAVEAARAGDAGRGFAVVASEVRTLAQRSSQAAKDIKDLITNSNGQVQEGVDLVNKAGEALGQIVESIKDVADLVSDIAGASLEQSSGVDEVNRALTQMDEVTQQNSALVEENAATAKTLEHQAKTMDERVSFFRVDTAGVAEAAAPALASRRSAPRTQGALALQEDTEF